MTPSVKIFADSAQLCQGALELTLARIEAVLARKDSVTLALAGGSTPKALYQALAQADLPWSRLQVFWGDERYVPADHPDSNQRMARQVWLDQVDLPAENIHPMPTESADPQADAERYESELARFFQVPAGAFPAFDLILLGLGDDGHTASLFPHTPALEVKDRLVTVGAKDGQPRLTFTAPLINQAHCVCFLVSGAGKQAALKAVLAPEGDAQTYPARLIRPQGELFWLLDEAAAGT
ncbi:MAG: 6-phosphogluconolactonase [Cyanobacteria bacterium RI_101]|nr:6-phosphogluconolactonase [Cyanobacteria bacterium RI_101]